VNFQTDPPAIGQYIKDGKRDMSEPTIRVSQLNSEEVIKHDEKNIDEINYIAGKSIEEVNEIVHQAAVLAHTARDVTNLIMHVPALDAYTFCYLVYFFQKACAMSGNLFEVNPFNQPGVEAYKNNMHALLGKPGFEKRQQELEEIFKIDTLK